MTSKHSHSKKRHSKDKKNSKILVLKNIPDKDNTILNLERHFIMFGEISSIYIGQNFAEIQYVKSKSVLYAINSTTPFANNRLILFEAKQKDEENNTDLLDYIDMKTIKLKQKELKKRYEHDQKNFKHQLSILEHKVRSIMTESEKLLVSFETATDADKKLIMKHIQSMSEEKKEYDKQIEYYTALIESD